MHSNLRPKEKHSNFFLGVLVTLIASSGLLQYFLKTSGFNQGDSWAYNFGSNPDFSNISFTGHSLRRWPIVLINTILQREPLQILAQSIISIVAWSILIITLGKLLKVSVISIILVTALSVSPQVLSWNSIQLSESYAISSGVLLLSFLLWYQKHQSVLFFTFVCSSLFFFLNTKPSNYLACLILVPPLMMAKVTRTILGNLAVNKKRVFIVGLLLLYSGILAFNQSMSDLQTDGHGESYSAAQAVAVISNVNPLANVIEGELLKAEILRCLKNFNNSSPVEVTNSLKHECHSDEEWLSKGFQKWYLKFLFNHPVYALKTIATGFTAGNSPFSLYGASVSILPSPMSALFFGERNYANRLNGDSASNIPLENLEVTSPIIFWSVIFLIFAPIRVLKRKMGQGQIEVSEVADSLFGMVGAFGLVLIAISSISIPNEWFRQSIVGQIALLLAGIIYLQRLITEFARKSQP
jgi:hypothetical protein